MLTNFSSNFFWCFCWFCRFLSGQRRGKWKCNEKSRKIAWFASQTPGALMGNLLVVVGGLGLA